ncbi:transporter substrate-binding domain-containing protein [Methylobacterium sp. EM32]|uniref:transporter substrate-binding domain-containing protein n=1 Tax=Methylobacterium sp. EM32 TaxID=3163481 RepID=UPI0033A84F1B
MIGFGTLRTTLAAGLAALALATTSLAPAAARTLDEVIASGTLRVGVNPTLPPLGKFDETNTIVGFDVDFATEIAKTLGVKLEVVQVGSPDRIPFVTSGKIDVVMGAMTRTPERAKVIEFTVPVHTEVLGVLTTEDQPYQDWKSLNLPGVTFVEVRGSTPVKFIADNLPQAKVTLLDNYPDAVRALSQKRGTAMIDVIDFMGEHMRNYPNTKWKILPTPIDTYYCSMGVARNATGLKDWLNVAIFDMHRRGRTAELWKKWFGMDMIAPVQASPYF